MSVDCLSVHRSTLHTHEASGEGLIGPDLAVHLDQTLLDDRGDLTAGQSVLQSVAEEDGEGERLPELVGTGGRAGSLSQSQYPTSFLCIANPLT